MNKTLNHLFTQLSPQDVEQFHQSYQRWALEQQIEIQQSQIAVLEQKIAQNAVLMEQVRPSAIALSTLAQLQASGVEDIELLDQMLERGEAWLDRTMQHLEYCERMDLIGESHTEWCRHALEGAYDWIESLQQKETTEASTASTPEDTDSSTATAKITEDLLLQKLMSEGDTENTHLQQPRITAPLPTLDELSPETDNTVTDIEELPAITETIELAEATAETMKISTATAPEPTEASDPLTETASEITATIEPVAANVENIEVTDTAIEQDNIEPVVSSVLEVTEPVEPAISQAASDDEDGAIHEPEQEEQIEEITATNESDTAATLVEEMEQEAEIVELAQVEDAADEEPTEVLSTITIEPVTNVADVVADEATIADSTEVITEVPPDDDEALPTTSAVEDVHTTALSEEEEEMQNTLPSDVEASEDGGAALPAVAEPPQQKLSSPSVETDTQPDSIEAAQPAQEQQPKTRPYKKRGFFRRLLAFLLS